MQHLQAFRGFAWGMPQSAALQSLQQVCRFYVLIDWAKNEVKKRG
jgi:hypothetical protein